MKNTKNLISSASGIAKWHLPAMIIVFCSAFTNAQETDLTPSFKQAIEISPLRLFDGTFQMSYDRKVSDKWSINMSGQGTYASENGYGKMYLESQKNVLSYTIGDMYFSPRMITGFGAGIEGRNYLRSRSGLPLGLYAAPYLSYRKVWMTSTSYSWENDKPVEKDHTRNLDIFSGGVLLGGRLGVIKKIYSVDFSAGAGIRFSKYSDENHFTRFRTMKALDYSGVLPTASLKIGILK